MAPYLTDKAGEQTMLYKINTTVYIKTSKVTIIYYKV